MARGRMINQVLCASRKFDALKSDLARLTYTLLLTFADREGRTEGDPCLVRSRVYPRRTDVTDEMVASCIDDMEAAGLILQYDHEGEKVVQFTQFGENQIGLRFDREPPSPFPPPPPAPETGQPPDSGIMPELCRHHAGMMPATGQPPDSGTMPESCRHDAGIRSPQVEGEVEVESIPPPTPPGGGGLDLSWIDDLEWRAVFGDWAKNKKNPYKSLRGRKAGYARLVELSAGDIGAARKIVERSLGNNWIGLFELPRGKPPQGGAVDFDHRIE